MIVTIRAVLPIDLPENEANPWQLIAAVPPELRSQPVLNGYAMGGPLILSGIRPYVDGRGDMYGDELVVDYKRITDGDAASLECGGPALEHPLGDPAAALCEAGGAARPLAGLAADQGRRSGPDLRSRLAAERLA